uniref:Zinc knuckle CX2CX4HX4C domain-containing protein n=2 Tax=Chenopodium quinoa TaxID=63459 RepID=A0A803LXX6_CHEQI
MTLLMYSELGTRWDAFLRIKVSVDINKPLRRGLRIANGSSSPRWCGIQYERLADFCYYCSRLNHTDVECQFVEKDVARKEVVYEYGPWLGASPKKQDRGSMFDREREKSWLSKIKESSKPRLPGYSDPKVVRKGPPGVSLKLSFTTPESHKEQEAAAKKVGFDSPRTFSLPEHKSRKNEALLHDPVAHNPYSEVTEISTVQHAQCPPAKTWRRIDRDVDASMVEYEPIAGKRKSNAPNSPTTVDESSVGKRPRPPPSPSSPPDVASPTCPVKLPPPAALLQAYPAGDAAQPRPPPSQNTQPAKDPHYLSSP